ncbi:MAG: diguanylate cyclase [Candidatus Omnitrophica bacterium]|nr:diguanylate cyclase [Candidatus Omnitrophota bacterium]
MMDSQQKEIRELKQALLKANEDIEKLSRLKSDFVSVISHELRTPLTSIKESVSLVLDEVAGPLSENQKVFLNIAKNNIDRLAKIIIDILDFSKLEAGRSTMHKKKMDINKVINDVCLEMREDIKKNELSFDTELSDKIEKIWLDPKRISQALRHLIDNAIKFNRKKGSIKISTNQELVDAKEVVRVSIEDTGISIPQENLQNIFDSFMTGDSSMTRKHKGVGIGLSLCKRIVDYHGGELWVESKEDVGSKFIFTLPIYKKDDEFNFLLDEAIERAKYNDMRFALIVFGIKNKKDINEENLSELEKDIHFVVRGPEDKVTRFKDGEFIVIMAETDRLGAEKIVGRMKGKVRIPLNFGVVVYPDDAKEKDELIKEAEKKLGSKKNTL